MNFNCSAALQIPVPQTQALLGSVGVRVFAENALTLINLAGGSGGGEQHLSDFRAISFSFLWSYQLHYLQFSERQKENKNFLVNGILQQWQKMQLNRLCLRRLFRNNLMFFAKKRQTELILNPSRVPKGEYYNSLIVEYEELIR